MMRIPAAFTTMLVAGIALCSQPHALAQEDLLLMRLHKADTTSSLVDVTSKPWHLKLDVTVFDDDGKNPISGTVERWQSGSNSREVFSFGSSKFTRITNADDTFEGQDGPDVPYRAFEAAEQLFHPGPNHYEIEGAKPELYKQSAGKVDFDCIMLAQPIRHAGPLPVGLFPTYCLARNEDRLLESYNFGGRTVLRNRVGKFLDHEITVEQKILDSGVVASTTTLTSLSTYVPTSDEFKPADSMVSSQQIAKVAAGVITGNILKKVPPIYPAAAKQNHISGSVVLRAIIGRDGQIHLLRPVGQPDPDLALSAITAVRQWRYKPYLLNGRPTEVDTTITVNFNMNINY